MGTEVSVASVVYNLAGELVDRPNYLKSLVVQNTFSGGKVGMGDAILSGQLAGPAMKLRSFYRWASSGTNYSTVGIPTAQFVAQGGVDPDLVAPYVPHGVGETVHVQVAEAAAADPVQWARQWILVNRLADIDVAWEANLIDSTTIHIWFPDTTTETITISGYVYSARYLYVTYALEVSGVYGDTSLWIYRIGSGNTDLDVLVNTSAGSGSFFPFIPFRLNNQFISDSYHPTVYPQVKKAFKRAISGEYEDLIEQLSDNPDLGDIDHAYAVFGVSLNTKDQSAKKYIYKFFEMMQASQPGGAIVDFDEWASYEEAQQAIADTYNAWLAGGSVGTEPPRPVSRSSSSYTIRITGSGEINSRYDIRIGANYIANGTGTGLSKPDAKVGEVWLAHHDSEPIIQTYYTSNGNVFHQNIVGYTNSMRIYWQKTAGNYTFLHVVGGLHTNMIYGSKSVRIDTKKALADGDESGFIIPLHYETWTSLSLKDANQMATSCCYAVFNCYEVRKTRWYESGIFRIFLVIVIAIASVVFTGGAGLGLLGTHLAVGSALGFSGMTAAIVGSVINALAGLLLATLLEKTLGGLGVLGTMLSTVVMILAGQVASAFSSGQVLALDWGQLLRVDNLMKLTDAVGRGLTGMLQEDAFKLQQNWLDYAEYAKIETSKIQQAYFNEFGYGAGAIDPLMFVDTSGAPIAESSDTFLTRTLMTGSEIAEMSRELLYEFPTLSLKLPDAFT